MTDTFVADASDQSMNASRETYRMLAMIRAQDEEIFKNYSGSKEMNKKMNNWGTYNRYLMQRKQGFNKPADPNPNIGQKRQYVGVFKSKMSGQDKVDWYEQTMVFNGYYQSGLIKSDLY